MNNSYYAPLIARANKLARNLKAQGSPSTGTEAVELWEILSSHHGLGYLTAKALYIKAGYVPFRGYPLERNSPPRSKLTAALNAGTVPSLPPAEQAEVKRLLENGGIYLSVSGQWIAAGVKS